jgi:hypothetical protein
MKGRLNGDWLNSTFETNLVSGMRCYNAKILYGTSYSYLRTLVIIYCSISQFNLIMEPFHTQKTFWNPNKFLIYEPKISPEVN